MQQSSPYDPDAPSSPIKNSSVFTLSPNKLFSQAVRNRRRNLLVSVFISISCYLILAYNEGLKISSILLVRFDKPIEETDPVVILLAVHITYALVSFLIELFSEMKKLNLSFSDIYPRKVKYIGINKGGGEYLFNSTDKSLTNLLSFGQREHLKKIGTRYLVIGPHLSYQMSQLFLGKSNLIGKQAITVKSVIKDEGTSQNERMVIDESLDNLSTEDSQFIRSLRFECASMILNTFRKHTYKSLVWWFEVFFPVLISIAIVAILISSLF